MGQIHELKLLYGSNTSTKIQFESNKSTEILYGSNKLIEMFKIVKYLK